MEINFRPDREVHLRKLCEEMGRSVDDFADEALLTFMEDDEDGRDADAALAEAEAEGRFYTAKKVREELGLDDHLHAQSSEAA